MSNSHAIRVVMSVAAIYSLVLLAVIKGYMPFIFGFLVFVLLPDNAGKAFLQLLPSPKRKK